MIHFYCILIFTFPISFIASGISTPFLSLCDHNLPLLVTVLSEMHSLDAN